MPDYTSILRRSISALPDPNPEMREAVYQRARAALARQLTAVDPPLSSREIETQHQQLEDAVAQLEADLAPEHNEEDADQDGNGVFYEHPPEPSRPAQEIPAQQAVHASLPAAEPPDHDDGAADEDEDDLEEEDRSSRLPLMVGVGLLALAVIGVGAYGFTQLDNRFGSSEAENAPEQVASRETPAARVVTPEPAPAPEPDASVAELDPEAGPGPDPVEKRPDRLTNGTEPPPAPEPPQTDVAVADPLAPAPPPPGVEDTPVAPLPEETPPRLQGEQTTAAVEGAEGSIVAQRAIYYFQGAEGAAGQATEGNVTWAQTSRDSGPAIQATLRLPDREVTTTVTIYRNTDNTLPASHLVEIQFSGELGKSRVQRVPALVMKQTEQARGQPLTGAAVPVTDNLFWIALSDDAEQVTRNVQLLREGSWFDVPILFEDGTRALLTFEKGIPGDRVFETVLASWTPT